MNVKLINGSPHHRGCTYTALRAVADELEQQGIDCKIIHVGGEIIRGCNACYQCGQTGACVFDDVVNRTARKLTDADGLVFGTPVYYAGVSGQMKSFMDRLFVSAGKRLAFKPSAVVVSGRRGGCVTAFDDLNKYLTMNHMPVVPSQYWNQVHGSKPEDVLKDEEGIQTMQSLARNMAWLIKCIKCGEENGILRPRRKPLVRTNFTR